jgi:hypothetical protein
MRTRNGVNQAHGNVVPRIGVEQHDFSVAGVLRHAACCLL